ncbi:prefoldin subunit 4 [Micractinium conductrix]|uniref:Prefoldin subunit 4 n=1 Tax=Micractinium conductrix TaxID=554055 RepID=A0A2P6VRX1_9CHLO|nr:prefoldin subunit 4 [Micractinium conductrix]|eukprot:PSC76846.1 prefoldin subunit 4 [Micractinium conductrix]
MDVRLEDQQKINTFSRLNTRLHELEAQVAAKKKDAEDLEEAGAEVMLLDDETVPYVVGECLVHLPREEVEERLQAALDEIQEETKGIEGQMRGIKAQMQELKAQLYARFGSSINLEE